MKNFFKKIAEAKASKGGNFMRDGKYRLMVKHLELEKKESGNTFVGELVVKSSSKIPNLVSLKTGEKLDIEPQAPGSTLSFVQVLDDPKNKSAASNVTAFVLALMGLEEHEVEGDKGVAEYMELLAWLTDRDPNTGDPIKEPKDPARGMLLDCETYRKITKENKIEIILPRWDTAKGENEDAAIAARRAEYEGKAAETA